MPPEQSSVVGVETGDYPARVRASSVIEERHELILALDINHNRRTRRIAKIVVGPKERAVRGIQRNYRVTVSADGQDDRVLVSERAARIAAIHLRGAREVLI